MGIFEQKAEAAQQARSVTHTMPARAPFGYNHAANAILHLQSMIGNQAVQRLMQSDAEKHSSG